ncbi:right-handed parallel beta-helix repeat-containing protein [Azotosporobacter soli]|uniref:right-handed parallel beta-helix repeat-containing protein n=1 Tax=Azotosporobacter soli TaxID=3055040 RepID=UPI0031FF3B70
MKCEKVWIVAILLLGLYGCGAGVCTARAQAMNVELGTFGAKGDGIADDTASLQTALNSLKSGQVLHIPAGTYKVTQIIVPANAAMLGDDGAIILGGENGGGIFNIASDHVTMTNLIIDGAMKRKTAVKNDNANYTTLEKCEIRNTMGDMTMGSWAILVKGGSNISIANCSFHDISGPENGIGGDNIGANRAVFAWNVKSMSILNSIFTKISGFEDGDGIHITGDNGWISDVTIQGCTFSDFYKRAVKVQASGVKIINNTMTANPATANSPEHKQFQAAISIFAKNTRVEGNKITLYHSFQGIGVEGIDCKIIGNTIVVDKTGSNYNTAGIYVSAAGSGATITGNTVKNIPAPNGIDFRSATNVNATNNIVQ